ncbi:exotoxin [Staphylococcus intermedius]|uniref:exotoxin n=1 Tax=Staphylococcus intermedius TaxID=1285 RepID=UPI000BBC6738|nr:exotoxin [Staphylococcus intermedius]PCF87630.1 exotoxin [Staphylococcus intermedius]
MNKKQLVISLLCSIIILCMISSSTALANHMPDPTPDQLNKSSKFTGLMENMKFLYEGHSISVQNVKSFDSFLGHDLIFDLKDRQSQNQEQVKTELISKELAEKYKNQRVDIFGTNYYANCYFSGTAKEDAANRGKTCMYGGLTAYQGNHLGKGHSQTIYVQVFENGQHTITFNVQTDKKIVTAQELDIKARQFLVSKLKLYEFGGSPYETAYIKFVEYGGDTFWYDMMPPPGDKFDQSKYLLMYRDNKTVDSRCVKIEVHLTKNR